LEIQARWYTGWKDVVRTDCKNPKNALCFPSPEACPYEFPEFSLYGWNAHDSTLVFITTGILEGLWIDGVPGGAIGIWWKNRMTNAGNWVGMGTRDVSYPFVIPGFSNAIIQVGKIVDRVVLETDKGRIEVTAMDGWANPYAWPVNWVPIVAGAGAGAAIAGAAGYLATREPVYALLALPGAVVGGVAGYMIAKV